mmetsp:Transcript_11244/g.52255  ORF Transcript_11244/g.52255 Transcript_11244/m.52255 type:complete len:221 (-) Transcript_11244:3874-4536(-)
MPSNPRWSPPSWLDRRETLDQPKAHSSTVRRGSASSMTRRLQRRQSTWSSSGRYDASHANERRTRRREGPRRRREDRTAFQSAMPPHSGIATRPARPCTSARGSTSRCSRSPRTSPPSSAASPRRSPPRRTRPGASEPSRRTTTTPTTTPTTPTTPPPRRRAFTRRRTSPASSPPATSSTTITPPHTLDTPRASPWTRYGIRRRSHHASISVRPRRRRRC